MAYSKTSNTEREKSIKYLNKNFSDFKDQLTEFAESYFPVFGSKPSNVMS